MLQVLEGSVLLLPKAISVSLWKAEITSGCLRPSLAGSSDTGSSAQRDPVGFVLAFVPLAPCVGGLPQPAVPGGGGARVLLRGYREPPHRCRRLQLCLAGRSDSSQSGSVPWPLASGSDWKRVNSSSPIPVNYPW